MKNTDLIKRYLLFTTGLFFLSLGVVLIVRSLLGTTPISSVNYVLSLNTPLSLGTCTFIINMILILGQFLVLGRNCSRADSVEILLQIPFSFVFGFFIDVCMYATQWLRPEAYWQSLCALATGCISQAVGVVLEIKPRVAMMSAEGFVKYLSARIHKDFGRVKIVVDLSLVATAALLSLYFKGKIEGIREGTIVAATLTGLMVTFLNCKVMTRRNMNRILHLISFPHA